MNKKPEITHAAVHVEVSTDCTESDEDDILRATKRHYRPGNVEEDFDMIDIAEGLRRNQQLRTAETVVLSRTIQNIRKEADAGRSQGVLDQASIMASSIETQLPVLLILAAVREDALKQVKAQSSALCRRRERDARRHVRRNDRLKVNDRLREIHLPGMWGEELHPKEEEAKIWRLDEFREPQVVQDRKALSPSWVKLCGSAPLLAGEIEDEYLGIYWEVISGLRPISDLELLLRKSTADCAFATRRWHEAQRLRVSEQDETVLIQADGSVVGRPRSEVDAADALTCKKNSLTIIQPHRLADKLAVTADIGNLLAGETRSRHLISDIIGSFDDHRERYQAYETQSRKQVIWHINGFK